MYLNIKAFLSLLDRRQKRWIFFLAILSFISGALEILAIAVVAQIINFTMGMLSENPSSPTNRIVRLFGYANFKEAFVFVVVCALVLYLVKNLYSLALEWATARYTAYVDRKLGRTLFDNYLNSPYAFKISVPTSELLRNITTECSNINSSFTTPLLAILNNSIVCSIIFVFMLYRDPLLFGALSLTIGMFFFFFQKITKPILVSRGEKRQSSEKKKNESILQAFYGFKETKLFNKQDYFINEYYDGARGSGISGAYMQTISKSSKLFLELVLVSTVLVSFVFAVKADQEKSLLVNISIFGVAMFRILPSLVSLLQNISAITYGSVSLRLFNSEIKKVAELTAASPAIKNDRNEKKLSFEDSIKIRHVSYAYPNKPDRKALNDVSFTIKKNECIAIIGESGGGKTTLVDIVSGLLFPTSGEILIDGISLRGKERFWWPQIGYIPQQIYLYNGTIRENIAFGISKEAIDMQRIKEVIKMANIEELVAGLDRGDLTEIGENGIQLSGGQRQRIGIARALYQDPSLLIMDEATAALDNISEYEIMQAINNLTHQKKTIIIIAHRLSTIKECDKIFVLQKGELIEQGTYDDLLKSSKILLKMLNPSKEEIVE